MMMMMMTKVCLGPEDKPAVFAMHGGNGPSSVGLEMALAMGGRRSLIAVTLTSAAAAAAQAHPSSVVLGLAAHYADAIQQVQPQGPYSIAGIGRGAYVAYETARELEIRGQVVSGVAALDVPFQTSSSAASSSSSSSSGGGKDIVPADMHIAVQRRYLSAGLHDGLTEAAAEQMLQQLHASLASADSLAARKAALNAFMTAALSPAILATATHAVNTFSKAIGHDGLIARGAAAPLLQAPIVVVRSSDIELMLSVSKGQGEGSKDLGWHLGTAAGVSAVIDVPCKHLDLMLTSDSAAIMAGVFETL
jgi:thioesterase domain-containing protein